MDSDTDIIKYSQMLEKNEKDTREKLGRDGNSVLVKGSPEQRGHQHLDDFDEGATIDTSVGQMQENAFQTETEIFDGEATIIQTSRNPFEEEEPPTQVNAPQVQEQQRAPSSFNDFTTIIQKGGSKVSKKIELDINNMVTQGMITPQTANSRISEEYRLIKLPLLRNGFGRGATHIENGNVIMVTSSQPNEGKTFSTINLAMSMAMELEKTVLLIDADVAKPSVARYLKMDVREGLVDFLLNPSMELSDVILRTNIPKLSILPAGRIYPQSTELLASDAMRNLVAELSQRYHDRVIIFDSPPLLASSEAAVLAHLVGQIVMVVEAERTLQYVLNEALSLLDPNKVIGLLLNKSRSPAGTDYYGTYAYHG